MDLAEFKNEQIDRVIATCLIVHLAEPEDALLEWRRVCASGGLISIYVACEPGMLLRLLRQLTTVRKAKKFGLNHIRFHYREHITFFSRIDMLIEEIFEDDKIVKKFWPLRLPFWNLNLGVVYQIYILKESI
jgi:ubiquinone/menaquinone biosynthesis C-methylase UbiE